MGHLWPLSKMSVHWLKNSERFFADLLVSVKPRADVFEELIHDRGEHG